MRPAIGAPIGWTLCSGIGAPEVAAPWVDWRMASEIEKFPRAVLAKRFGYRLPEDHNQGDALLWGDFTEITPDMARARGVPLPDLLVAGTPCQAFSMAGLRKGVADARGNLTLKFVETCHAIVNARPDGKLAVLWENVFGVLSDKENAFGCFVGGIVGADDALSPPDGGSWPSAGMVSGPRARVAWRVFNAQHFGVAQRRRRVFLVADFGGAIDPAAVLFEQKGQFGSLEPRREAGQNFTYDVAPSLTASGRGVDRCGDTRGNDPLVAVCANSGDLSYCLTANSQGSLDGETETMLAVCVTGDRTHALTAEGFDASEDGTGRGTPIVAFDCKGTEVQAIEGGLNPPLRCAGSSGHAAVAFAIQERAVSENPHSGPDGMGVKEGVAYTLEARQQVQAVASSVDGFAVRRLTPVECHRLQGFPDDHCAITYRGKPAADGPQYKALGNSMAVPNVAWILERIRISAGWV